MLCMLSGIRIRIRITKMMTMIHDDDDDDDHHDDDYSLLLFDWSTSTRQRSCPRDEIIPPLMMATKSRER
jgi:hypothetical protein